jgi:hypothetical protein
MRTGTHMKGDTRADEPPHKIRKPSVVFLFFYWLDILTILAKEWVRNKDPVICCGDAY